MEYNFSFATSRNCQLIRPVILLLARSNTDRRLTPRLAGVHDFQRKTLDLPDIGITILNIFPRRLQTFSTPTGIYRTRYLLPDRSPKGAGFKYSSTSRVVWTFLIFQSHRHHSPWHRKSNILSRPSQLPARKPKSNPGSIPRQTTLSRPRVRIRIYHDSMEACKLGGFLPLLV